MDGGFGIGRGGRNGHSGRGTWARRIAVGAIASGTAAGLAGLGLSRLGPLRGRRRRRAAAGILPAPLQTTALLCVAGAVAATALFRALAGGRR